MLKVLRDALCKLECSVTPETRDLADLKRILQRRIAEIELTTNTKSTGR